MASAAVALVAVRQNEHGDSWQETLKLLEGITLS
jgi:hypothetical protein